MDSELNNDLVSERDAPALNSRAESSSISSPSSTQEIVSESSHVEELRERKLIEEELELVKNDRGRLREELQVVKAQNLVRSSPIWTMDEFKNIYFDSSVQLLGSDESWSIHKGFLSHSQVTVRIWHGKGLPDPREFNQEVETLSKLRHPNLISLMGVCAEAWALVYEHLPSGNLQQWLSGLFPTPLLWQARIKIATGLCSGLIFLHSRKPRVVHGALTPSSIFLDSNLNCKIGEFGFSYVISHDGNSPYSPRSSSSRVRSTLYIDPSEGGVSPLSSDVYAFGIILFELLTRKMASGVAIYGLSRLLDYLQDAVDNNRLSEKLDTSAGQWPYVQALKLARLGLSCCGAPTGRPDLETIWEVLRPMSHSCEHSLSCHIGEEEHHQTPSCFFCPLTVEVMTQPYAAADGYSYERAAITTWIEEGHTASPVTNQELGSLILYPNHLLRSAIHEWRDNQQ